MAGERVIRKFFEPSQGLESLITLDHVLEALITQREDNLDETESRNNRDWR